MFDAVHLYEDLNHLVSTKYIAAYKDANLNETGGKVLRESLLECAIYTQQMGYLG